MANETITIIRRMDTLQFDAVLREAHESSISITENPVERGVSVADHFFVNPKRITIEAGVTDTPLNSPSPDPYLVGMSRSQRAYELLLDLQAKKEPFEVQTGLRLYQNMMIQSIRTEQDKLTARTLIFIADLREVQIVNTQVVKYPPRKPGATARQAASKKNRGRQTGKTITHGSAGTGNATTSAGGPAGGSRTKLRAVVGAITGK